MHSGRVSEIGIEKIADSTDKTEQLLTEQWVTINEFSDAKLKQYFEFAKENAKRIADASLASGKETDPEDDPTKPRGGKPVRREGESVLDYADRVSAWTASETGGNGDVQDSRRRYVGGNSGYVGYSMSKRAAEARCEGSDERLTSELLGEVAPEKRGGFLRKAKNLLLDIEPKTVRKEIRNNNLLWTRYSVESNSSDESQGLDRHQAKMSELNENGLNPQSKSYIDKDNANKTNLQEVKRGLESGEIEDIQESRKKKHPIQKNQMQRGLQPYPLSRKQDFLSQTDVGRPLRVQR